MSSYFKTLRSLRTDVLIPATQELLRSAPDSLFIGTLIFAGLTRSFPLGIFVLALAEIGLFHRLFAGMISGFQSNVNVPSNDMCNPGIPSPYRLSLVGTLLGEAAFPSGPIFFITAAISYILSSTLNFREELKELGKNEPEWNLRIPLSIIFSSLFFIFFVIFRVAFKCDSVMVALGSAVFGGVFGGLIYLLHVYLFGRDAVNFLGLPLLADRAANGRPLYVCAKQD
jgi:hypothetical protein